VVRLPTNHQTTTTAVVRLPTNNNNLRTHQKTNSKLKNFVKNPIACHTGKKAISEYNAANKKLHFSNKNCKLELYFLSW
jgi:uncharacterized protein YgiM (DUF1202 family)